MEGKGSERMNGRDRAQGKGDVKGAVRGTLSVRANQGGGPNCAARSNVVLLSRTS